MTKSHQIGKLLFNELRKITQLQDVPVKEKIKSLLHLMSVSFVEATKDEKVLFTTLFARISYASSRYKISKQARFFIHHFRIHGEKAIKTAGVSEKKLKNVFYPLGIQAVTEAICALFGVSVPQDIQEALPHPGFYKTPKVAQKEFYPQIRVVVTGIDEPNNQLIAQDYSGTGENIRVQYNIPERNENFNPTIRALRKGFDLPVTVNLLEVSVGEDDVYRPSAFVLEPDYLIDVTAIAECFKDFGTEPMLHLLKRFLPFQSSVPLMIGNIANYFLDELMTQPNTTFEELFPKVFKLNPLAFTLFDNHKIRDIQGKSQFHYKTLKEMVSMRLEEQGIAPAYCYLEPSFYSERYGIQGRLDVFYQNPETGRQKAAIVELKSGKTFKPNRYGINHNHYTQTLLYDLLIRSAFDKIEPTNYILYSGLEDKPLRFAPTIKSQQFEAIQVRNQLVAIENALTKMSKGNLVNPPLLTYLQPKKFPKVTGFVRDDLVRFQQVFTALTPLERKYFTLFTSFIAREHRMAKMGQHGSATRNGQAAIWLNSYQQKEDQFEIISHLRLSKFRAKEQDPFLWFDKTTHTNHLANFRRGDIALLYPYRNADDTPLQDQVFKCTIINIDNKEVQVRLRSRQFNTHIFEEDTFWNIEHDLLDSGYTNLYRSLFAFAQASPEQRALLLTQHPPARPDSTVEVDPPQDLTQEQQEIYQKIIRSKDYFLLWGPPGTGKTSMMLHYVVQYLWQQTDQNILLMAYTNRAVDEICESIERIDAKIREDYIRIGSRFSTSEKFQKQLLDYKLGSVETRKGLSNLLQEHRIFVGTVNGIAGKSDLFKLKKFQQVIIDEASQLLEPYLVGMLPNFERFILIGDHQQLPAVVQQSTEESAVEDPQLQAIGVNNLSDSFFERLYKRAISNGWDWAHAQLSHQGRMHRDIMVFPNHFFYQDKLNTLPATIPFQQQQIAPLQLELPDNPTWLEHELCAKRVIYLDTAADETSVTQKTNHYEALKVVELMDSLLKIYKKNNKSIRSDSIGVITPYRAQIAQIRQQIQRSGLNPEQYTIDTVERYQGGARDIIVISLCTNSLSQLDSLVSMSEEGVDRKLNVALTRARQQLIILGNREVLKNNAIYGQLIKEITEPLA